MEVWSRKQLMQLAGVWMNDIKYSTMRVLWTACSKQNVPKSCWWKDLGALQLSMARIQWMDEYDSVYSGVCL